MNDQPRLRDAAELLYAAVADSVARSEDKAAARLALEYAQAIDLCCGNPDVLDALGPKLLAVLESLGLTPLGRAKAKGPAASDGKSQLAQLRAARS